MTAARYKVPVGFSKMAGRKFGLNLLDLFGDDETDSSSSEGFLPQFTTKTVEKGRGGVLGYKAPRTATRESTLQILPSEGAKIEFETEPKEEEKVVEPEREALGSLAGKFGQSGLFGNQDYYKAIEAGYKPEEIRSYIEQNPYMVAEQNRPGKTGGLYEQIVRGSVNKPAETFTPQEFLDRQIATQTSSPSTPTQSTPSYSIEAGMSADYLGRKDVEAAQAQGASNQEIAQWIKSNQDKLRGPNVEGGGGLYDQYKQYM